MYNIEDGFSLDCDPDSRHRITFDTPTHTLHVKHGTGWVLVDYSRNEPLSIEHTGQGSLLVRNYSESEVRVRSAGGFLCVGHFGPTTLSIVSTWEIRFVGYYPEYSPPGRIELCDQNDPPAPDFSRARVAAYNMGEGSIQVLFPGNSITFSSR